MKKIEIEKKKKNVVYFLLFQAKDVLDELEKNWLGPVELMKKEVVGRTKVLLDGDSKVCRRRECSMGNFIADAMIDYVRDLISRTIFFSF